MKEITRELEERDCVVCMNCGKIYEGATREEYLANSCSCSIGYLNWVTGWADKIFWGTKAAKALAMRVKPPSKLKP